MRKIIYFLIIVVCSTQIIQASELEKLSAKLHDLTTQLNQLKVDLRKIVAESPTGSPAQVESPTISPAPTPQTKSPSLSPLGNPRTPKRLSVDAELNKQLLDAKNKLKLIEQSSEQFYTKFRKFYTFILDENNITQLQNKNKPAQDKIEDLVIAPYLSLEKISEGITDLFEKDIPSLGNAYTSSKGKKPPVNDLMIIILNISEKLTLFTTNDPEDEKKTIVLTTQFANFEFQNTDLQTVFLDTCNLADSIKLHCEKLALAIGQSTKQTKNIGIITEINTELQNKIGRCVESLKNISLSLNSYVIQLTKIEFDELENQVEALSSIFVETIEEETAANDLIEYLSTLPAYLSFFKNRTDHLLKPVLTTLNDSINSFIQFNANFENQQKIVTESFDDSKGATTPFKTSRRIINKINLAIMNVLEKLG